MRYNLAVAMLFVACRQQDPPMMEPPIIHIIGDTSIKDATVEKISYNNFIDESKVLSSFKTKFAYEPPNENRALNIQLAASKLDGVTLAPNERFSFNEIVGERSEDVGYLTAPVLYLGTKQKGIGGGTCQVSSTLYAAAMYGGMDVINRASHSRPSDYIPKGYDSTVSYPDLDLEFINPYNVPIRILAYIPKQGEIEIKFVGLKKDFKVKNYFQNFEPIPFEKQIIKTKYHKKPPEKKQNGKDGVPGFMYWTYVYEDGGMIKKKVYSNYKPVNEVWYANTGYDGGTN